MPDTSDNNAGRPRRHHELDAYQASGTSPPTPETQSLNSPTTVEQLLTTRRLAELLGETPRWVLRMTTEQELPAFRLGGALRYRTSEVLTWLEHHRVNDPDGNDRSIYYAATTSSIPPLATDAMSGDETRAA